MRRMQAQQTPRRAALFPQVLQSARLTLRPPRAEDVSSLYEGYARDPEVARYEPWRPARSVQETDAFLRRLLQSWANHGPSYAWVISTTEQALPIGIVELDVEATTGTLGYVLRRSEWGRGYATEAARAVVDLAFANDGLFRIWAWCDTEHVASCRVLEKIGMQREATFRRYAVLPALGPEPRDVYCYARTRG